MKTLTVLFVLMAGSVALAGEKKERSLPNFVEQCFPLRKPMPRATSVCLKVPQRPWKFKEWTLPEDSDPIFLQRFDINFVDGARFIVNVFATDSAATLKIMKERREVVAAAPRAKKVTVLQHDASKDKAWFEFEFWGEDDIGPYSNDDRDVSTPVVKRKDAHVIIRDIVPPYAKYPELTLYDRKVVEVIRKSIRFK